MYQLVNKNIIKILKGVDRQRDINPYLNIMKLFNDGPILHNERFQFEYRKYYQLNAARLSVEYCNHYFHIMDDYRHKDHIHINDIVDKLYEVPTNAKDKKVIMFSFASKLFHTIDNSQPLYDSFVADIYFFPKINPKWKFDKKLVTYLKSYYFLQKEYRRIIDNHLLSESIEIFRKRFELPIGYTDYKIIDTLLWRFGAYLRNGAVISGEIQYS